MYVARIHVQNFRCFEDITVEFNAGVNVIIGENNAGKTALLRAMGLVFNREHRPRIKKYDFYQGIKPSSEPPEVEVAVTLRSSHGDTVEDKALVATWLTKLEAPWEAMLTYRFFLPEDERQAFKDHVETNPTRDMFWRALERHLPKYVSRIYGGNPEAQAQAEPEWLSKFSYQFLDAIRDVQTDLFSGSNPMLREMLNAVLDDGAKKGQPENKQDTKDISNGTPATFQKTAKVLKDNLVDRMDTDRLFELVKKTGAEDAGEPVLGGTIGEDDLIGALKLFIEAHDLEIPATHNGLGYNNLLYISLVLANLDFKASPDRSGANAVLFPILLIEEPEAHLHPALQYKLLKFLRERVKSRQRSRQVFITTHSTHITAAVELDSIICMSAADADNAISVAYPGKVFGEDKEGRKSKKYVERFLDATKSNMLFAKGVIFVEGLAEQLLLPCFAEYIGSPLEDKHVAVIAVGGSTFKHFLPIFGAGLPDKTEEWALRRRVACIVDADPSRKERNKTTARWKACFPYMLDQEPDKYEYKATSGVIQRLVDLCRNDKKIAIFHGKKTLEYDLAEMNSETRIVITGTGASAEHLRRFVGNGEEAELPDVLEEDETKALVEIQDENQRRAAFFASCYLRCTRDNKGEHAFDLERALRENLSCSDGTCQRFTVPKHIEEAIRWVWRTGKDDAAS